MVGSWNESYMGKMRQLVGTNKIISNSVRALISDEEGRILFIQRRGDRKWGMPAGAMELNESISDCLKREVKEETGIEVLETTLIAVYSNPSKQSFTDRYGNEHQIVEFLFRVDKWTGVLQKETDESVDAEFYPIDHLPEASNEFFAEHHEEVIKDLKQFQGTVLLR